MRNGEPLFADYLVVVENDVDVDGARGVCGSRGGLLHGLGSTVAPQVALDALHGVEHLERRKVRGDLQGLIREARRRSEAPRLALVAVRTAQDCAHAGIDELLRRLQRALHVAFVAPQKKCHSCHRHRCFIILLTESAKWVNTIVGLPFCAICAAALSISAISGSIFRGPTKGANFEQKASSSPQR